MKIIYLQQSSLIDNVLKLKYDSVQIELMTYNEILVDLMYFGFITLFGFTHSNKYFFSVPSSKVLLTKWANENNFKYSDDSWQKEILAAQIEVFQPDVIYTGNHSFFTKNMKNYLPQAKLYALWNASPMKDGIDLSHFDVGLSFNEVYHQNLHKRGIKNTEYNSFYIDSEIKKRLDSMRLKQDIDIAFVGRYAPMFKDRNKFLYDVYKEFKHEYNIQYYLLTKSRVRGLIPMLPLRLLNAYNKPVFLKDMFKVFNKSKIVLNTHSNITGTGKGNMRVFEALGSGTFMLTDDGQYPEHLTAGEDFVTYKNNKDMVEKISFYLNNDKEREEIARNGYNKIKKYYSTEIGAKNLEMIFGKYL